MFFTIRLNKIFILIMKKVKFLLAFIVIGIIMSACEFSPEEIQPVGDIILEYDTGGAGEDELPESPDLPDDD